MDEFTLVSGQFLGEMWYLARYQYFENIYQYLRTDTVFLRTSINILRVVDINILRTDTVFLRTDTGF